MLRLALLPLSLALLTASATAADLDRPYYSEREPYYDRPAPRVVERERIIEHHHHYVPAPPVHVEKRIYVEPRTIHRHHAGEYRPHYTDFAWRPRRFFRHWHHDHHHHRHHRHW
jgi:hypothetical protein